MVLSASFSGLGLDCSLELESALLDAESPYCLVSPYILLTFEEEFDCLDTQTLFCVLRQEGFAAGEFITDGEGLDPTEPTARRHSPLLAFMAVFLTHAALIESVLCGGAPPVQSAAGHSAGLVAAVLASAAAEQGAVSAMTLAWCAPPVFPPACAPRSLLDAARLWWDCE